MKQAEASLNMAKAVSESSALNLDFTQIRSPIDGRVSEERVTIGNLVQPGAGPNSVLTTVVSIDPIYV
jgi:multidrug resistance efflux pump